MKNKTYRHNREDMSVNPSLCTLHLQKDTMAFDNIWYWGV